MSASLLRQALSSASFRRRTRPETSPRSFNGFPFASRWTVTLALWGGYDQAFQRRSQSIPNALRRHPVTTRPANGAAAILPFAIMCVGMFVALLDIQIVASSLQDIGGGLSAAQDQIGWVQTAYLIAEIIMIPLSGWLTRVFSTRWLFTRFGARLHAELYACGLAWNIDSMIVFRALQGMLGHR